LKNLQSFWSSCTSEDVIDKAGATPLLAILDTAIDTWRGETVQPEFTVQTGSEYEIEKHKKKSKKEQKKWDPKTKIARLTNALTFLHSRGSSVSILSTLFDRPTTIYAIGIDALFSSYPEGDVGKNPKIDVLWLSQAGLGLPAKDYYKDKKIVGDYQKVVEAVLEEIYSARKEKDMDAKSLAKDVVRFEKEVAKISLDV